MSRCVNSDFYICWFENVVVISFVFPPNSTPAAGNGQLHMSVKECWITYNILKGFKKIDFDWEEVASFCSLMSVYCIIQRI